MCIENPAKISRHPSESKVRCRNSIAGGATIGEMAIRVMETPEALLRFLSKYDIMALSTVIHPIVVPMAVDSIVGFFFLNAV